MHLCILKKLYLFFTAWHRHIIIVMARCFDSVFSCGLAVNIHSDHLLRNLRQPGESTYKIPHGGLFDLVSAPNYLGKI